MKVKLKDGRVLPIEEGSLIALDDHGETLEVKLEDVNSVITDSINWEQRRYEIAKEMLMQYTLTMEMPKGMMIQIWALNIKPYKVAQEKQ